VSQLQLLPTGMDTNGNHSTIHALVKNANAFKFFDIQVPSSVHKDNALIRMRHVGLIE